MKESSQKECINNKVSALLWHNCRL